MILGCLTHSLAQPRGGQLLRRDPLKVAVMDDRLVRGVLQFCLGEMVSLACLMIVESLLLSM